MFQCIGQPTFFQRPDFGQGKNFPEDIRFQLNEQLKSLDGRLECQLSLTSEIQDVFRRRGDLEANYSKEMEKLAKYLTTRSKEQKQRRESWQLHSSHQVWETLVHQIKKTAKDHSALAEIYSNQVTRRLLDVGEDLQRVHRKCREIGQEIHEEVVRVLVDLHTAMKTNHKYQSEFRQTESKLQVAQRQVSKAEAGVAPEKREKSKKLRLYTKELRKRQEKYEDARLKATRARNEYLLCIEAANAAIQKYFVDDLSDLIDCMDFGFHQSVSRAMLLASSGQDQVKRSLQSQVDRMARTVHGLDSRADKQRYFEAQNAAFMVPRKFEMAQVHRNESEFVVHKHILDELATRRNALRERLEQIKAESEEIWKSMDSAEKTLAEMVGCQDYEASGYFADVVNSNTSSGQEQRPSVVSLTSNAENLSLKQKTDRSDTEDFYLKKFREYILNSNRIARLQAKYDTICQTLGDNSANLATNEGQLTLTRRPNVARRRRIGNNSRLGQPKLFGGSLEEYLEATNQDLPPVVRSCVRVINLFGLHHHGIFRVSGSQVEINQFKEAFERGEDPLAEMVDASDINSVAGVMKLYLRELREPVFPIQYFDHFMDLARSYPIINLDLKGPRKKLESKHEFVIKVRDVVTTWPRPVFVVMRYIFAFLNHLSEFSDENMMDPYNLAICFGPTLVPIPEERDQVQFQNLVNELIKNFIVFHEDIFPDSVPGPLYEKYLTNEPDEMEEAPSEVNTATDDPNDGLDSEMNDDEEDSLFSAPDEPDDLKDTSMELFGTAEVLEAQALYDFKARSSREVSFQKGNHIQLFKHVSSDWWRGSVRGQEGLIPDKYITLTIRGDDDHEPRERLESMRSVNDEPSAALANASPRMDPPRTLDLRSRSSSVASSSRIPGSLSPGQRDLDSVDSGNPRSSSLHSPFTTATGTRRSSEESQRSPTTTEGAATTVIQITGPVTNLDDLRGGGGGTGGGGMASSGASGSRRGSSQEASFDGGRSRLPVTMEDSEALREESHSQESLSSTGSNQEFQRKLSSHLHQVEAFTDEVEKRTRTQHQGGARPRVQSLVPTPSSSRTTTTNDNTTSPTAERVVLRQSSWGSRETALSGATPTHPDGSTTLPLQHRSRTGWENQSGRGTTQDAEGATGGSPPDFKTNRSFWEQKVRSKHTPDLVLDLPVTTSGGGGAARHPVPKPRSVSNTPGTSSSETTPLSSGGGRAGSSAAVTRSSPVTSRPKAKVKPLVKEANE